MEKEYMMIIFIGGAILLATISLWIKIITSAISLVIEFISEIITNEEFRWKVLKAIIPIIIVVIVILIKPKFDTFWRMQL